MKNKYYHTSASVDEYIKAAKGFDGALLIKKLKDYLPKNASLLELGSGPGKDWDTLSKDYVVTGSDFSAEFLKRLRNKNREATFLELDAATLKTGLLFNGVYSNKVLHHLTDDELASSIKRQAAILDDDGIICHSFWKGEGTEEFKGMFVNYHTQESLRALFEVSFELIILDTYKEFEKDDSILLLARKK